MRVEDIEVGGVYRGEDEGKELVVERNETHVLCWCMELKIHNFVRIDRFARWAKERVR